MSQDLERIVFMILSTVETVRFLIGQENYVSLGTLAREEYVYSRIMDNSSMFSEVELQGAANYITRLRRRYK